MGLEDLRKDIDCIDDEIVKLYTKRMELVERVVKEKEKDLKPVFDPDREKKILVRVTENVQEKHVGYVKRLFETLFETSKALQTEQANYYSEIGDKIEKTLQNGESIFPNRARVACQGISGSYSSIAAERLFDVADISYFKNFEGVFSSVEKGFTKYGLLPIENSSAGSVNEVYDLMKKHKFYVVKCVRLAINHNLVSKPNVKKEDIKEILSHEQAINQCKNYLSQYPNAKITAISNTAVAAKMVSESTSLEIAAICSRECAELYGLKIIESNVQDSDNNYTRFILIAKDMEFYKGASKISIMTTLPQNTPGSLNKLLSKFSNLGINLTKLESRPIVGSGFEFTFYFDFNCDIREKGVINLLKELDNSTEQFTFLGAYSEI